MWILLVAPVAVIALVSVVTALRRAPVLPGVDPPGLRTVVEWRDRADVAADVAGDPHEQLRQLVGALAEKRFILSSSLDRAGRDSVAVVDVHERRYQVHLRPWRAGGWLLWIAERERAPADTDELRRLLTGLYRSLEERGAERGAWYRREAITPGAAAPSPFYVA